MQPFTLLYTTFDRKLKKVSPSGGASDRPVCAIIGSTSPTGFRHLAFPCKETIGGVTTCQLFSLD